MKAHLGHGTWGAQRIEMQPISCTRIFLPVSMALMLIMRIITKSYDYLRIVGNRSKGCYSFAA